MRKQSHRRNCHLVLTVHMFKKELLFNKEILPDETVSRKIIFGVEPFQLSNIDSTSLVCTGFTWIDENEKEEDEERRTLSSAAGGMWFQDHICSRWTSGWAG